MLSDPNDESPANIDAAVMWRNDKLAFKKRVRDVVRKSQEECWEQNRIWQSRTEQDGDIRAKK